MHHVVMWSRTLRQSCGKIILSYINFQWSFSCITLKYTSIWGFFYIKLATCSTSRLFEVELPANIPRDTALKVSQCCHEQVMGTPVRMILRQQTRQPQDALISIVGKKEVASFLDYWKERGYTEGLLLKALLLFTSDLCNAVSWL